MTQSDGMGSVQGRATSSRIHRHDERDSGARTIGL